MVCPLEHGSHPRTIQGLLQTPFFSPSPILNILSVKKMTHTNLAVPWLPVAGPRGDTSDGQVFRFKPVKGITLCPLSGAVSVRYTSDK
jgi:hypothetical protein